MSARTCSGFVPSSVEWPFAQFQLSQADKDDTKKLLATINGAAESQLSASHLSEAFEKWWPDLERTLSGIPQQVTRSKPRSDRQLLEEILTIVRQLSRDTPRGLPSFIPGRGGRTILTMSDAELRELIQKTAADEDQLPPELRFLQPESKKDKKDSED